MATPVKVPSLGESVTSGILVQWLKEEGATVAKDEAICVIETDKANADLPAQVGGVLHQLRKAGETVNVGEAVGEISESTGAPAAKGSPKAAAPVAAGASSGGGSGIAQEDMSPAV